MTCTEAIGDALSKYARFRGRSSRSAYWYWYLFTIIVLVLATVADAAIGSRAVSVVVALALALPHLAVTVRRYHDAGHSGWWLLVGALPIVGLIVWLLFTLKPSQPSNRWGDGPGSTSPGTAVVTA